MSHFHTGHNPFGLHPLSFCHLSCHSFPRNGPASRLLPGCFLRFCLLDLDVSEESEPAILQNVSQFGFSLAKIQGLHLGQEH